jgi:hypothetical protein
MKAFTILRNGQEFTTIGVGDSGLLSAVIHWASGRPEEIGGEFFMMLGGVDRSVGEYGEHLRWHAPRLALGDEITFRLVEAKQVNAPEQREPGSPPSPELLREAGIAELLEGPTAPQGEAQGD